MERKSARNYTHLAENKKKEPLKRAAKDDDEANLVKKMRKPLADRSKQKPPLQQALANPNVRVLRNKVILIKNPPIVKTRRNKAENVQKVHRRFRPITVADLIGEEAILSQFSCFRGDSYSSRLCVKVKLPEKMKLLSQRFNFSSHLDGQDLSEDIMEYLFNLEVRRQMSHDYFLMEISCISSHTRAVLIAWLVEIQDCLGLAQETLYLTVMVMDRILCMNELSLNVLQLLGIAALFLITKLEERFPPEVKKLVSLTDDYYTCTHLILMERYILRKLKFNLIMAEPMCFLNRFIQNVKNGTTVKYLSMYFLDTFLLSKESAVLLPSRLSGAAFWLACSVVFGPRADVWESVLAYYFTNSHDLNVIMLKMLSFLLKVENSTYKAVKEKYSSKSKFEGVSVMPAMATGALQALFKTISKQTTPNPPQ